jgi:hypothetical protein
MSTAAPRLALQIGQTVRRRTDPEGAVVGVVVGLVLLEPSQALVRWPGAGSTFEPEDSLVEVFVLRR